MKKAGSGLTILLLFAVSAFSQSFTTSIKLLFIK